MASGSKYDKEIQDKYNPKAKVTVDVYRVMDAFEVTSQPRGHAVKKLLCSGKRGKGDEFSDVVEAIDALLEDADIVSRKAKGGLSPKMLKRLETLRRAEGIVEIVEEMIRMEDKKLDANLKLKLREDLEDNLRAIRRAGEVEVTKA